MKPHIRPVRTFAISATSFLFTLTATLLVLTALAACTGTPSNTAAAGNAKKTVKKTMRAFTSEEELKGYFRKIAEERKQAARRNRAESSGLANTSPPPAPTAQASAESNKAGAAKDEDSVTNTQHAGVDEGGIVKLHGDHLVVLRRGRLFTVAVGDNALKPISAVDAFGPEIDPRSTWYDEMLVSDDTVVVIGFSYQRGGTEVGLFNIDRAGNLSYRSTYHLRSNDYYSSRNYASRLIGSKLIFYTPLYMNPYAEDPTVTFPAVRKWHKGATPQEFQRIVSATRVYRPEREISPNSGLALHTVTVCDLASDFKCDATAVLGPPGRVFYVSPESVYVWTTEWSYNQQRNIQRSMVYRLPLDGTGPSALGVSGSPVDQFSFLESGDKHLNVLVRSNGSGDGMWGAERTAGEVALLRVPVSSFNDGTDSASSWDYHGLPKPAGYTFQNRFVGDYLLYGTGSGWGAPQNPDLSGQSNLYAVRWADGDLSELKVNHGVDRIEALGSDAIVVGTDGSNLRFSAIRLGGSPEVADEYIRKGASQGELRSHGFFYKPDGPNSGVLGLPISVPGRSGYQHLFQDSAAILFLRNNGLRFEEIGELGAQSEKAVDDACRASCVDWYGNSRPLFVRGRIIAMLGYELVEGTVKEGRMRELRRVNYSPQANKVTRRITD
ncbi:MAG TPA: beta-propeller domain-containing protein [Pyrinomonadaceae bacterium]|nr:beta-propeller domain-containing protein [Pyrinomonadaceae bacterium]